MTSLLTDLTASFEHKNEETIKLNLQAIISQGTIIDLQTTVAIEPLFQQTCSDILRLTAEAIAEMAKSEQNGKVLTTKKVTAFLLSLLAMIKHYETSKHVELQTVAWGFMLNLVIGNDDLQKAALEFNILNLIESTLKYQLEQFDAYEDCCTRVLSNMNILTDLLADMWLSEGLYSVLVEVLKISTNPEISVLCWEVLHGQAENNNTKLFLAKKGICELVEKYKDLVDDEETRRALKMACNIIVLILMGGEPMNLLYGNMLSWLNSDDFDLLSTGILAIGNFARNDTHCIQMVQNSIAKRLLDLLSKHNTVEKDMKVQHAILGALRNLVILPLNKAQILHEGLRLPTFIPSLLPPLPKIIVLHSFCLRQPSSAVVMLFQSWDDFTAGVQMSVTVTFRPIMLSHELEEALLHFLGREDRSTEDGNFYLDLPEPLHDFVNLMWPHLPWRTRPEE